MLCSQHANDYILLPETPHMHARGSMARFIQQEVVRPSKQWICNIIDGTQEQDDIILRTDAFILLPDTERVNRYLGRQRSLAQQQHHHPPSNPPPWMLSNCKGYREGSSYLQHKRVLNWLSILNDRRLRTLRDLRGHHVPMLKRMLKQCMAAIETHTGIPKDKVMAYVHYPPSVYQLHVHFSYPYGQYCHRDAYRVHSLEGIINNLQVDSDYYVKSTLTLALYKQSLHYAALTASAVFSPDAACKPSITTAMPVEEEDESEEVSKDGTVE